MQMEGLSATLTRQAQARTQKSYARQLFKGKLQPKLRRLSG